MASNKVPKIDIDGILDLSNQQIRDLSILESVDHPEQCKALKLTYNNITEIKHLQKFSNLEELDLGNNQLTRIENLNNLNNLKKLFIYNNKIKKIEGIENLKKLQVLNLSYNEINAIEGIENLEQLKNLFLDYNSITRLSDCENLVSIEKISLDENPLQELECIHHLSKLQELRIQYNKLPKLILDVLGMDRSSSKVPDIEIAKKISRKEYVQTDNSIEFAYRLGAEKDGLGLNLNYKEIGDIKSIKNLSNIKNLKGLDLYGNQIKKIEGLEKLNDLSSLNLGNNNITQIEGLEALEKLEHLNLKDNEIKTIENLNKLIYLRELSLKNNKIEKIRGLGNLNELTILNLEKNKIQNLEDISSLSMLVELNLSNNPKINDFSLLSNLKPLRKLKLKNNKITDISIELENLEELDLTDNSISNISSLNLPRLKVLNLSKNQLKSMKNLCQFQNLECLNLNENQINELECIDEMKQTLNKFYIEKNNLNLEKTILDKLKIPDNPRYPQENNSRRFLLFVLLKKYFSLPEEQQKEEIDLNDLFDESPILQKLKNMNEYHIVRDIVKIFRPDYEIRIGLNKIPISIVSSRKIAFELEDEILSDLTPNRMTYPLEDLKSVLQLTDKDTIKHILKIIKEKKLTKIPFMFTSDKIWRVSEKKEKEEQDEKNRDTSKIMSYLLKCFEDPDAIRRKEGDPQIQQLAHYILGKCSASENMITLIDVGAGRGDLLIAIKKSGILKKISYIPIEIDEKKWPDISSLCNDIEGLKFSPPFRDINDIRGADLIFFVNVFHELGLEERIDYLFKCFKLIQNRGQIIVHEVTILTELESNFLMWDADDFKLILSKINSEIKVYPAKTYTRPNGWPLQTISIKYSGEEIISKEEIRMSVINSLMEMKKKWLNYPKTAEFSKIKTKEMKNETEAFIMAQNLNIDLWIDKYTSINQDEKLKGEKTLKKNDEIKETTPKNFVINEKMKIIIYSIYKKFSHNLYKEIERSDFHIFNMDPEILNQTLILMYNLNMLSKNTKPDEFLIGQKKLICINKFGLDTRFIKYINHNFIFNED